MRGFWFIVEAVFASIIMVSFLLFMGRLYVRAPALENLDEKTYELLKGLDEQGVLRNYTVNGDFLGLDSEIELYTHNHSVEICNYDLLCEGVKPNASNVWVGTYLVAGNESYNPHMVKLYLWQGAS